MDTKTEPATTTGITFRDCPICARTTTQQLSSDGTGWYCRRCSTVTR